MALNSLLPTTVVGSYAQPHWLIDKEKLGSTVPRVRMHEVWRVSAPYLEEAQNDATLLAVRDMERAGIDIVTDGEMRRESYSNRFATAVDGIDQDNPATIIGRAGKPTRVPRIVSKIRRRDPVEVEAVRFLRQATDRTIKITVPGPFTMAQQAHNEFYDDDEEMAMDFAAAVNEELRDLVAAGADIVQLDEPWMQAMPDVAERYAVAAINRAFEGINGAKAIHVCFGYAALVKDKSAKGYAFLSQLNDTSADMISIEAAQPRLDLGILKEIASDKAVILGVLDLGTSAVESADEVAGRIRNALEFIPAERIIPAPDCGMKYLERDVAFGKLSALSEGASIVRRELTG